MEKIYVLDTSVLLADPNAISAFKGNCVIIPSVVLTEIDSKKKLMNSVGFNAREITRKIDEYRSKGSLFKGVEIENDIELRVLPVPLHSIVYEELNDTSNDAKIIATAKVALSTFPNSVTVVSKDCSMRVRADAIGLKAEDYENDKVVTISDEHYEGYKVVESNGAEIAHFNKTGELDYFNETALPNEFTVLKNGSQESIAIKKNNIIQKVYNYEDHEFVFGLQAKSTEQKMALELLLDPNVPLVTLTGKAGTGKTLMAIASGLAQTLDKKLYTKVIVGRPVIPMGKDIGYLPGELEDKLRPWMQPIYDNLEFLFNCNDRKDLESILNGYEKIIDIEALTYIRGRSIPNQFIIIDEAQNLTQHEVKTILTRVGEGAKIVLVGDPEQIDHPYLDQFSNGLTYVIEKMKHLEESGHVSLKKGERSKLAQLSADLLI